MSSLIRLTAKEKFVQELDGKGFSDLSENFQSFISYMFKNIQPEDMIYCKRYNGSKIDCIVHVNAEEKNVSLSKGDIVCVHRERIYNLLNSLFLMNTSPQCLYALLSYHFGDGTYDGTGVGMKCHGELLKNQYKEQIEIVNAEFQDKELLSKVIDYVLIDEKNGKKVDYFYHGDMRKGIFATADTVKKNMVEEENNYPHHYMRIGTMNFMPLNRKYFYSEDGDKYISILKLNLKKYIKKREN